jgi:hypothetical protein
MLAQPAHVVVAQQVQLGLGKQDHLEVLDQPVIRDQEAFKDFQVKPGQQVHWEIVVQQAQLDLLVSLDQQAHLVVQLVQQEQLLKLLVQLVARGQLVQL